MGRELEFKYAATEEAFAALQARFAPLDRVDMLTAYYDTPEGSLSRRRWTLRRRMENEDSVCTCKIPLADGSRGEWEAEAPTIEAGIPALCRAGAPRELLSCGLLQPVCGARFTRRKALVTLADAAVELALDRGVLLGGGREAPLLELEIEYISGSETSARRFAEEIAAEFGLKEESLSKFARAKEMTL